MSPFPADRPARDARTAVAPLLATSLLLLSACGGGGAGDGTIDRFETNPVDAFVGVYDLTGDWDGTEGDEATLVIRTPDEDGEARVLLYDLDDLNGGDNCYFPPSRGIAFADVTGTRVFMDRLSPFDEQGELALSGSTLVISYRDGPDGATLTYRAPAVGLTETDIENRLC